VLLDKLLNVAQIEAHRAVFFQAHTAQLAVMDQAPNRAFADGQEFCYFRNSY